MIFPLNFGNIQNNVFIKHLRTTTSATIRMKRETWEKISVDLARHPENIYLFKVSNKDIRKTSILGIPYTKKKRKKKHRKAVLVCRIFSSVLFLAICWKCIDYRDFWNLNNSLPIHGISSQ